MKLNIVVGSGIHADGFDAVVTDGDDVVDKRSYAYGYDCSYDRGFANERKPYVTDVLQGLIDQYHADEVSVTAGKNTFTGEDASAHKVQDFETRYCTGLKLPDAGQDFADAVSNIPVDGQQMDR